MSKRTGKTMWGILLTAALAVGMTAPAGGASVSEAKAKSPKLSASSVKVTVGKTKTIKVKNTKKKAVWSVKSGKKNVALTKKKKASVTVKGKKAGKAVVLAKVAGKKLTCKVTVKKAVPKTTPKPNPADTPSAGVTPKPNPTDVPPAETTSAAATDVPSTPTGVPPAATDAPPAEAVPNVTIDLSKCGETTFSASPAKIDFSSQIDSRFDLKLYDSVVVGYELNTNADLSSGYAGKIGVAGTPDTLNGYDDGVAFTYNMIPSNNSVTIDLSSAEGTVVGINVQPMDGNAGYAWPTALTSVTITSIEFIATPGAVYPDPGAVATPTPVPNPTYAPEAFTYEGLDTSWIDPAKPMVAFTFDDGPVGNAADDTSMRIQSALKKYHAHATFFYIGSQINTPEKEDEIKQAVANGFEIGNHSWGWGSMNSMKEEEIKQSIGDTNEKLTELSSYEKFLFRPPNLAVSATMQGYIKAPFIMCKTDSKDWANATAEQIIENVEKAEDGDIVLMHETQKNTAEVVEDLLEYFTDKGWQVVSVSELFSVRGTELTTGKTYSSCPPQ